MADKPKQLKVLSERDLAKKYQDSGTASVLIPDEKAFWLPSRNISLNWQLGGGIPYGKILELYGFESTGKSLLAKDFAYTAQQLGGVVLWGDAERSFDPHWAKLNGLDLDRIIILADNSVEVFSDWMRDQILYWRSILTKNEPILLVVDSVAAWDCEANMDADQSGSKAEMGNRAKAIYNMYRKRNKIIANYGVCMIALNQVRDKVGASQFEEQVTTPGGAATKFYASQRVELIRSKQIKGFKNEKGAWVDSIEKGKKVGQNIIQVVKKNKVAPPAPSIKTEVYFTADKFDYVGYCRYAGLVEILLEMGIISIQGNTYYFKDKKICLGRDNFLSAIHSQDELRAEIIRKSKINTISRTRKKLETTITNFYPVNLKGQLDE